MFTNAFLTEQIDIYGNTNRFEYTNLSGNIRLLRAIDAQGLATTISYVTNNAFSTNLVSQVVDPFNRTTTLQYDSNGNLTNITDVAGLSTSFPLPDRRDGRADQAARPPH